MSMKEYSISVKTTGYEYYTVNAESEEEALALVASGDVDYDEHEWEENGEPFIDE